MILEKEFYFVRHGQTDMNISKENLKKDHPFDTPLNETGRHQAKLIEPLITSLPIQTVCSSPMKRAQETKEIIPQVWLCPITKSGILENAQPRFGKR